jgi:hypothetical protein
LTTFSPSPPLRISSLSRLIVAAAHAALLLISGWLNRNIPRKKAVTICLWAGVSASASFEFSKINNIAGQTLCVTKQNKG